MKVVKQWFRRLSSAKDSALGAGKAAAAAAVTAALLVANTGKQVRDKAAEFGGMMVHHKKKDEGVVTMKKSTWVVLLVALAAVAGVLGALYVYVLRREKELDEYEQLLFSEDFNDELPEEPEEEMPEPAKA